jgi:Outer membrane protein beta-barrel domain
MDQTSRESSSRTLGMPRAALAVVRLSLLAALAALAAGPAAASAQGSFSLGGGVSAFSVSSDLIKGGSGGTYEFTFGYRFSSLLSLVPMGRLSMELLVTGSDRTFETLPVPSPYYPADTASFSLLAFGLRFDILDPAQFRWSPWLGVAPGLATLTWKTYAHGDGAVAPLLSLGVDVELASGLALRARFSTLRSGSGGSLSYQAASLGLVWEFLRPYHHRRPERWSNPARTELPSPEPAPGQGASDL